MSISNVMAFHLRASRRQPACVQATDHIHRGFTDFEKLTLPSLLPGWPVTNDDSYLLSTVPYYDNSFYFKLIYNFKFVEH